jgi:putative DNA primase/helicase
MDEVQDALEFISPSIERELWAQVAMGLKSEFGDHGRDLFQAWSQRGDSYNAADVKSTWNSVKAAGGINIGTVFQMAKDKGYEPRRRDPLTPEQERAQQVEHAKRQAEREAREAKELAERQRWHEIIADFSANLFKQFSQPAKTSPYLEKKQVGAFGIQQFTCNIIAIFRDDFTTEVVTGRDEIRQFWNAIPKNREDRDFSFLHIHNGDLAIPLIDCEKKVWNIQVINAGGTKMFLKHGRKSGLFHFIGNSNNSEVLAFVEGYATGASVHMAMGWPCAVAWDAGNLPVVAKLLKPVLPNHQFVFCADDDADPKADPPKNPGVDKANEAAQTVGGLVAIPDFSVVQEQEAA